MSDLNSAFLVDCNTVMSVDGARDLTQKLERLRRWLYRDSCTQSIAYRFAPSIILRSEAEMLGISTPRFALRAYLTDRSFINVRRRESLSRSVGRFVAPAAAEKLVRLAETSNWIADSLFEVPADLRKDGWRVLVCRLSREYGEKEDVEATPFVSHVRLGGGLCAQAGCFMALALTQGAKVYGIAEITRLAYPQERRFRIGGLPTNRMADVLSAIDGVDAILQQRSALSEPSAVPQIEAALNGYLASACPVIVPLSISRMFGGHLKDSGRRRQALLIPTKDQVDSKDRSRIPIPDPLDGKGLSPDHDRHAVVLVGWNRKEPRRFVLNDPATFPFVTTDAQRLLDSRPYETLKSTSSTAAPRDSDEANRVEPKLSPAFQCIPVTPKGVRAPLLSTLVADDLQDGEKFEAYGLLQVAGKEQTARKTAGLKFDRSNYRPGEFRLVSYRDNATTPDFGDDPSLDGEFWRLWRPEGFEGWCWVQRLAFADVDARTSDSIWFWNASQEFSPDASATTHLLQVVSRSGSEEPWRMFYPPNRASRSTNP